MEDTIKSKLGGYSVLLLTKFGDCVVFDGVKILYIAKMRSYEDYIDEVVNGENECAVKYDVFTDIKGRQYIYWFDFDTNENFITAINLNMLHYKRNADLNELMKILCRMSEITVFNDMCSVADEKDNQITDYSAFEDN